MFVVPGDGPLVEGDVLPGPLSVARRGDFVSLVDEWDPIFSLANVANFSLAVAAGLILAVILWRLAWLRRRELAILRTVGLPESAGALRPDRRAIVATAGFLLGLCRCRGDGCRRQDRGVWADRTGSPGRLRYRSRCGSDCGDPDILGVCGCRSGGSYPTGGVPAQRLIPIKERYMSYSRGLSAVLGVVLLLAACNSARSRTTIRNRRIR